MITILKAEGMPAFSVISGTTKMPKLQLTQIGEIIKTELYALFCKYDELELIKHVIMPDHIHFIIYVKQPTTYHLGTAIGLFKGACSRRVWQLIGFAERPLFADRFHDRILTGDGQLDIMKHYIADNPRRLLIKQSNPDLFSRRVFLILNGMKYEALGNIFLLRNPLIEQVRVSRRFTVEQSVTLDSIWKHTIQEGGVLVSPFISPREKVYRDLAIDNGGNVICIEENGLGGRYKPGGRYFDLCAEGRLLVIAPTSHHLERSQMTRRMALHLNDLAAAIAKGDFTVSLTAQK